MSAFWVILVVAATLTQGRLAKPLEENLPHTRDYYAGYIRAITDNFDQLFVNERQTRSTNEDEKIEEENPIKRDEDPTPMIRVSGRDIQPAQPGPEITAVPDSDIDQVSQTEEQSVERNTINSADENSDDNESEDDYRRTSIFNDNEQDDSEKDSKKLLSRRQYGGMYGGYSSMYGGMPAACNPMMGGYRMGGYGGMGYGMGGYGGMGYGMGGYGGMGYGMGGYGGMGYGMGGYGGMGYGMGGYGGMGYGMGGYGGMGYGMGGYGGMGYGMGGYGGMGYGMGGYPGMYGECGPMMGGYGGYGGMGFDGLNVPFISAGTVKNLYPSPKPLTNIAPLKAKVRSLIKEVNALKRGWFGGGKEGGEGDPHHLHRLLVLPGSCQGDHCTTDYPVAAGNEWDFNCGPGGCLGGLSGRHGIAVGGRMGAFEGVGGGCGCCGGCCGCECNCLNDIHHEPFGCPGHYAHDTPCLTAPHGNVVSYGHPDGCCKSDHPILLHPTHQETHHHNIQTVGGCGLGGCGLGTMCGPAGCVGGNGGRWAGGHGGWAGGLGGWNGRHGGWLGGHRGGWLGGHGRNRFHDQEIIVLPHYGHTNGVGRAGWNPYWGF